VGGESWIKSASLSHCWKTPSCDSVLSRLLVIAVLLCFGVTTAIQLDRQSRRWTIEFQYESSHRMLSPKANS
jgi:hypothetical protein